MRKVCPKRPAIHGIDVSKHQGEIDWHAVARDDYVDFAIIRAAYGVRKDIRFNDNWHECSKTPLVQGCYQYLVESQTGKQQANALCEIIESVGGLLEEDLPPVLDVEKDEDGLVQYASDTERLSHILDWIEVVRNRLDRVPIIYTTPFHWQTKVNPPGMMSEPLWISHVRTDCPLLPDSWSTWLLWQYSWTGFADGIDTKVDLNQFEGTVGQLKDMCYFLTPKRYALLTSLERKRKV